MDASVRQKLTEIIEAEDGKNWWQPALFEKHIRAQLPADLKIIMEPPSPEGNFNCFVYALKLQHDPDFLGGRNPVQQEFIRYLLSRGVLERAGAPVPGDLVFYEDTEGFITHGGVVRDAATVLSKWMWGPLFEHRVGDVPASFGDIVFYTKAIDSTSATEAYEIYKSSGVEIRPIT